MAIENHWLDNARRVLSPFCNERPDGEAVSLLVVHNISLPPGEFGGPYIEQLFTGHLDPKDHPYFASIYQLQVSAHVLIRRDGQLVQFVPFDRRAWHAGISQFEGRDACNDYSIGIELEGTDVVAFTDAQYEALSVLTRQLLETYPALTVERITGHQFIAPKRKSDPGLCFDWLRYFTSLK